MEINFRSKKYQLLVSFFVCLLFCVSNKIIAQVPDWAWAKSDGGSHDEHALCVATDGSGNSYAAGFFQSLSVVIGADTLTNAGYYSYEMLIVKYDAAGNVVWARSASGINDEKALSIAVDTSGNICIAGYFSSPEVAFGAITLTNSGSGYADMFVVKYDSDGSIVWAKSAWGTSQDYANGIAIDPWGNVYVTGYFYSPSMDFGGASVTNAGEWDIFIVKYNSDGIVQWAKSEGGDWIDDAQSIAVDASGNIYIAGWYSSSSITFGPTTLTNTNCCSLDILLAKYDSSGNALWAQSASGDWHDQIQSVTVDDSGNSYVTGYFISSSLTFGATTLTNAGDYDLFIAKYDAIGNLVWAQGAASGGAREQAQSIAADDFGNVYVTGWFASSFITFGSTTLTNNFIGLDQIFLVKLDASGNSIWAKSAGNESHDQSQAVAADNFGNVWIAGGYASSSITFDSTVIDNSSNDYDLFISKIGDSLISFPPVSLFSSSTTSLCEKFCIDFSDQSLNAPVSWQWIFDGGSPSTSSDQNPSDICYDDPGVFNVTLITTNLNGLSDTLTLNNYITVYENPFAPTITQVGNVLTSSSASAYQWYLNGNIILGATGQNYTITQAGLYTIEISDQNGCKSQSDIDAFFLGIESLNNNDITIYPNPSDGNFVMEFPKEIIGSKVHIKIFNAFGQQVFAGERGDASTSFVQKISLKYAPEGIYFIEAFTDAFLLKKKITIIH